VRNAYKILVGKRERNRPFGRPGCRWEDNIKLNVIEIGCGVNWIHLSQDRDQWCALVKTVINLRIP